RTASPAWDASASMCSNSAATSAWCCALFQPRFAHWKSSTSPKSLSTSAKRHADYAWSRASPVPVNRPHWPPCWTASTPAGRNTSSPLKIPSNFCIGTKKDSSTSAKWKWLRQDPDVILVGEMRDLETISTALHAAETGHLVFSTLHTLDAVETINRIIAVFPPPEQKQVRMQLGATLRAVVSQRLVKRADGAGRVPATEVLISTAFVRECIMTPEKTRLIHEAIGAGTSQYGMQTFDQSLYDLYSQGLVSYETALENASNPDDFKLKVQGIHSTADAAREQMEQAGFSAGRA